MATSLRHLDAIIVGGGFGGLATGIELARRAAKVRIFESMSDMSRQGKPLTSPLLGIPTDVQSSSQGT